MRNLNFKNMNSKNNNHSSQILTKQNTGSKNGNMTQPDLSTGKGGSGRNMVNHNFGMDGRSMGGKKGKGEVERKSVYRSIPKLPKMTKIHMSQINNKKT